MSVKHLVDLAILCGVHHLPNTSDNHARIYARAARWMGSCPEDGNLDHVQYYPGWNAEVANGEEPAIIINNGTAEFARIVPEEGNRSNAFTIVMSS